MLRNLSKRFLQLNISYLGKNYAKTFGSTSSYNSDKSKSPSEKLGSSTFTKYEPFRDSRSPVILDVEEERRLLANNLPLPEEVHVEPMNPFLGISPEPGIEGVIDLEELVGILKRENAVDLFVCRVPEECRYVKNMVIVSGKSARHMMAMAEFVRRVYKYKMRKGEIPPMIEGKKNRDWIALDLGNIALHIFSPRAREMYDLESLWALGRDFDSLTNAPEDPVIELLKQNIIHQSSHTDPPKS